MSFFASMRLDSSALLLSSFRLECFKNKTGSINLVEDLAAREQDLKDMLEEISDSMHADHQQHVVVLQKSIKSLQQKVNHLWKTEVIDGEEDEVGQYEHEVHQPELDEVEMPAEEEEEEDVPVEEDAEAVKDWSVDDAEEPVDDQEPVDAVDGEEPVDDEEAQQKHWPAEENEGEPEHQEPLEHQDTLESEAVANQQKDFEKAAWLDNRSECVCVCKSRLTSAF